MRPLLRRDDRGATYLEYTVLVGAVALAAYQAFASFGQGVATVIRQHIVVISGIGF